MLRALPVLWSYRIGICEQDPVRSNALGHVVTEAEGTLPVQGLKAWLGRVLVYLRAIRTRWFSLKLQSHE